jgi:hypothetical protein
LTFFGQIPFNNFQQLMPNAMAGVFRNHVLCYALADYYIKVGKFQEAKVIAEQMIAKHPSKKIGRDLLDFIKRKLK